MTWMVITGADCRKHTQTGRLSLSVARFLVSLNGNSLPRDEFVNAVPVDCQCSFDVCLDQLHRALTLLGNHIEGFLYDSGKCVSDEEHNCSEDSSEPSIIMDEDIDPFDCSKEEEEVE